MGRVTQRLDGDLAAFSLDRKLLRSVGRHDLREGKVAHAVLGEEIARLLRE